MPDIGPMELVIALLVLGPGKLHVVGPAFGQTIREFRRASQGMDDVTQPAVPAANQQRRMKRTRST